MIGKQLPVITVLPRYGGENVNHGTIYPFNRQSSAILTQVSIVAWVGAVERGAMYHTQEGPF